MPPHIGWRIAGVLASLPLLTVLACAASTVAEAQVPPIWSRIMKSGSPATRAAWQDFYNGPLPIVAGYVIAGTIALLVGFHLLRGRARIEHGWAGHMLPRFTGLERLSHWLLAVTFLVLALTGLNGLYGRDVLLPAVGADVFAAITLAAKRAHAIAGLGFLVALQLMFILWVGQNLPEKADFSWLLRAGGLFSRGSRPAAWKFNAGQKLAYWIVMAAGLSVSISGIALLFPAESTLFGHTVARLAAQVFDGAAALTRAQEIRLAVNMHAISALVLTVVVIAHAYVRTMGTQGAFEAMTSGQVDVNYARQHHSLWAGQEIERLHRTVAPSEVAAGAAVAE